MMDATVLEEKGSFLLRWMSTLLDWMGLNSSDGGYRSLFAAIVVVAVCVTLWRLLRYVLLKTNKIQDYIDTPLEVIFDKPNLEKIALTISVLIFYIMLPLAFSPSTHLGVVVRKGLDVMIVWMFTSAVNSVVKTLFSLVYLKRKTKGTPLKGFMQVVQIVVWMVGIIFIIGILIDQSPAKLFTGLGASLAVVSCISCQYSSMVS